MGLVDEKVENRQQIKSISSVAAGRQYQIPIALLDETICAMTHHYPCLEIRSQNLSRILCK